MKSAAEMPEGSISLLSMAQDIWGFIEFALSELVAPTARLRAPTSAPSHPIFQGLALKDHPIP